MVFYGAQPQSELNTPKLGKIECSIIVKLESNKYDRFSENKRTDKYERFDIPATKKETSKYDNKYDKYDDDYTPPTTANKLDKYDSKYDTYDEDDKKNSGK